MTAAVLGSRVHDDVSAVAQRLLEIRGGKRVVDDETGVAFVHDLGDRRDVDDGQQWVGRRLGPHDLGLGPHGGPQGIGVGEICSGPCETHRGEHSRDESERAAVGIISEHDVVAWRQRAQQRVLGRHA